MVVDAPEHILEPGAGVNIVEPCGLDQGVQGGGPLAAIIRRNLIMPGFWARRWRSPISSTRYAGVPRSSSPISSTTVVAI